MSDFLDAVADRVIIYDGATGTWLQERDLTADDFGGPELEGCNELLVVTRPDVDPPSCTPSTSTSASTSSRPTPSAGSRSRWASTAWPTGPTS